MTRAWSTCLNVASLVWAFNALACLVCSVPSWVAIVVTGAVLVAFWAGYYYEKAKE
jgi:hypothetical protein